jgi:hypothetical protein
MDFALRDIEIDLIGDQQTTEALDETTELQERL